MKKLIGLIADRQTNEQLNTHSLTLKRNNGPMLFILISQTVDIVFIQTDTDRWRQTERQTHRSSHRHAHTCKIECKRTDIRILTCRLRSYYSNQCKKHPLARSCINTS